MARTKQRGDLLPLIDKHRGVALRLMKLREQGVDPLSGAWLNVVAEEIRARERMLDWARTPHSASDTDWAYFASVSQMAQLSTSAEALEFVLAAALLSEKPE